MLELRNIAKTYSGVSVRVRSGGLARFVRQADLSTLRLGLKPDLPAGDVPEVARALAISAGDIVIGARGASTDIVVADQSIEGAYVSLDLYLVRPNFSRVDPRYLAAFLDLPATQAMFVSAKQGTGLARLPKDALDATPILLPSLHKQRQIAELVQFFADEARLLKRLTVLNSLFSREAVSRAVRNVKIPLSK